MTYTISITSQGQVTIPKAIRKRLGLDKPKKILVEERKDEIIIKPIPDFFSLYQSIKPPKKPINWKKIDESVADAIAQSAAKGTK